MLSVQKTLSGMAGLALFPLLIAGCGKNTISQNPVTTAKTAAPVKTPDVSAPVNASAVAASSPEVSEVAGNPSAYLGRLTLSGVVGIVNSQKGFVLVDTKEYRGEGFACLNTDEPTKISVLWPGTAPKVKETVQVDGQLVKGANGYSFTANKVTKK